MFEQFEEKKKELEGLSPEDKITKIKENLEKAKNDLERINELASKIDSKEAKHQIESIVNGLMADIGEFNFLLSGARDSLDSTIIKNGEDYEAARRAVEKSFSELFRARSKIYEHVGAGEKNDRESFGVLTEKFHEVFPPQS